MPITYRRPGVYLEESLLVNPADTAGTVTVACFVGAAGKGPINDPILCESWSAYVTSFGDFSPIPSPQPIDPNDVTSVTLGSDPPQTYALLQDDLVNGDGQYVGPSFKSGEYVVLGNESLAHYLQKALETDRAAVEPGWRFAPDEQITASDPTNAAKLSPGATEVHTLTPSGTISGGLWDLTVLGTTVDDIPYNATNTAIKALIDVELPGNSIAVSGGPLSATGPVVPVLLTYTNAGDVPEATVDVTGLTGTTPAVTVSTTTPGTGEGFIAEPQTAWGDDEWFWVENSALGPDHAFRWDGDSWEPAPDAPPNDGEWKTGKYPPGPGKPIPEPVPVLSYLPYAVYSFFQNGGRFAWIIRSVDPVDAGEYAEVNVNGVVTVPPRPGDLQSFTLVARSVGSWGDNIKYQLVRNQTVETAPDVFEDVFSMRIIVRNSRGEDETVENWSGLTVRGTLAGTKRVDAVINDPAAGSQYVRVANLNAGQPQPEEAQDSISLAGGVDPNVPQAQDLMSSAADGIPRLEGPITVNICAYIKDVNKAESNEAAAFYVGATIAASSFPDRQDIFVVNDSAPPCAPVVTSSSYKMTMQGALSDNAGESYSASYGPWIIVPNPTLIGRTIAIPPGGAVMGMMARVDATVGVFRAPAGVIAGLNNAVGVQAKFTDTELGDLNSQNINIIRPVVGAGICVMGGRTRKTYGADRYISARRTLIFIKEVMRRSTQFAVFENNDQRLWSALRMSAERVLRPLWEAGGLRGASASEAYFIRCDSSINTLAVISSGEVRMEMGVALEYPAEFVIIRVTQFDQGTFTAEVQPSA